MAFDAANPTIHVARMFDRLMHADWSVDPRKRWFAAATLDVGRWHVAAPQMVGSIPGFLDDVFGLRNDRTLVGFDFPIGVPNAFGNLTEFRDFRHALTCFGEGDWSRFFEVANLPQDITLQRPFYPRVGRKGVTRQSLVKALGIASFEDLLRLCERRTPDRPAACSLFWTLGGNQVGRAALSGWSEVIRPSIGKGALLWPFDGPLELLSSQSNVVLAETYPAEAYRMFDARFLRSESKRRQADRASKSGAIMEWGRLNGVEFSGAARAAITDGFGNAPSGEDAFDALSGLLKMIEVCDGRRSETTEPLDDAMRWEGWILGR